MEDDKQKIEKDVADFKDVIQTYTLGHANDLISRLKKFFIEKRMFDITLVAGVDETEFPVHRLILSAQSDYFLTMFSGLFNESYQNTIKLVNVTGDILRQIVFYCYSGQLKIHRGNSQELIAAATEYQFPSIVKACSRYLMKLVDPENCLALLNFAECYGLKDLSEKSLRTFCENFTIVTETDEFKQTPLEKLKEFLDHDDLHIKSEIDIVNAILTWVSDDSTKSIHMEELLGSVRLLQLSIKKTRQLIETFKGTAFENDLKKALKWRTKRRKGISNSSYRLMVIGGEQSTGSIIEYYCPDSNEFRYWKKLKGSGKCYAATLSGDELYIINGSCLQILNVCTMDCTAIVGSKSQCVLLNVDEGKNPGLYTLEIESRTIYRHRNTINEKVGSLSMHKTCVSACVVGEAIYIFENYEHFSNMRIFYTSSMNWSHTAITNHCHAVQIASINSFIYIISTSGGLVQRYNTINDTWTKLSDFPADCIQLYSFNNTLYACSQIDVYIYDIDSDMWNYIGCFNEHRCTPHLFCIDIQVLPDFM